MHDESCIRLLADQEQIRNCKGTLNAAHQSIVELCNVLALAGNEVRLKMLYLLKEERELCPCDLSDILDMTVPAVSQHLRKLKDGGLVQCRKEGQTIYYSLKREHLPKLKSCFKHISQGIQRLETA